MADTTTGQDNNQNRTKGLALSYLLYLLGITLLARGVVDIMTWMKLLALPQWLEGILTNIKPLDFLRALALWANTGVFSAGLGFWTMIAGYLAARKGPGYLLFSMAVLSLSVLTGILPLIRWIVFPASFEALYWPEYLQVVIVLLGVIGTVVMVGTALPAKIEE